MAAQEESLTGSTFAVLAVAVVVSVGLVVFVAGSRRGPPPPPPQSAFSPLPRISAPDQPPEPEEKPTLTWESDLSQLPGDVISGQKVTFDPRTRTFEVSDPLDESVPMRRIPVDELVGAAKGTRKNTVQLVHHDGTRYEVSRQLFEDLPKKVRYQIDYQTSDRYNPARDRDTAKPD